MLTLPEVVWQFWSWLRAFGSLPRGEGCSISNYAPVPAGLVFPQGSQIPPSSLPAEMRPHMPQGRVHGKARFVCSEDTDEAALPALLSGCQGCGSPASCWLQGPRGPGHLWAAALLLFGFQGQEGLKQAGCSLHFFLELPSSPGPFSGRCIYYSFKFPLARILPIILLTCTLNNIYWPYKNNRNVFIWLGKASLAPSFPLFSYTQVAVSVTTAQKGRYSSEHRGCVEKMLRVHCCVWEINQVLLRGKMSLYGLINWSML